jgi:hypothetical protein
MKLYVTLALLLVVQAIEAAALFVYWRSMRAVWRGRPTPGDCAHSLARGVIRLVQRNDPAVDAHPWPWIYFHGDCQDYIGERTEAGGWEGAPDLVASPNTHHEGPADGEHDVMVYDRPARLFLWTDEKESKIYHFGPNSGPYLKRIRRGLVCFPDDAAAMEYARKKLQERPNYL